MTATRIGPNTLEVNLSKGLFPSAFSRYQRDASEAFDIGDTVKLEGMLVTIESLNSLGDPQRISYTFDVPLEAHELRWLRYRSGQYEPWTPPATGETLGIEGEAGIFQ